MSNKYEEAKTLIAKGKPVVLPVATGSRLVREGVAVKTETTGHGKAKAEYVAA